MSKTMEIKLETKQPTEDWRGGIDENDVFYRYNIDGNLIWFSQKQDNGNIYSVSVALKNISNKYFDVWVKCDDNKIFYPNNIEIEMKHSHFETEDVSRIVADIHYVDKLCNMIMSIFKTEEHYDLWYEHHKNNVMDKYKPHHCELCGTYIEQDHLKVCDKCASEYKF